MYFDNCTTAQDCKTAYRELFAAHCKDAVTMADINTHLKNSLEAISQFEQIQQQAVTTHQAQQPADKQQQIQAAADFARGLPGVTVEITGQWVWVSGETKPVKDQLNNYGFKFARKKANWYFHTMQGFRTKNNLSMEQIRTKYANQEQN